MRPAIGILAFCILGACSAPEQLVTTPKVVAQERVSSKFASIEVADISLPSYAARSEIPTIEGDVLVASDTLWADEPTRAMTLSLARHLSEITRARVASEPWPFDGLAAGRVEVRVEELVIAAQDMRMSGQYFVVDQEDRGRDHAHLFELATPLASSTAASIAQSRAQILLDLANAIAADAL